MNIKVSNKKDYLIIKIIGDIDHHSSETIRNTIDAELAKSGKKNLVFDFSEVKFMDSSGIGMIIGRCKSVSGTVSIACMNTEINKIFNISGLQQLIKSYLTLEEAIN